MQFSVQFEENVPNTEVTQGRCMKIHQFIGEDPPRGNSVTLFSAAENGFQRGTAAVRY